MVGGFVCKKGKQEGSFWKKGYKGWGSLVNRGKVGGFGAKALLLPLPTLENRGGAARRRRRLRPAAWGSTTLREEGKRERRRWGFDSPT